MRIAHYQPHYASAIAELFTLAVHAIDEAIYNQAQKAAWAPKPVDVAQWQKRLAQTQPFVLLIEQQVAGFMELEQHGHIDCAYVHPTYQRQGVASALFEQVRQVATRKQLTQLTVEASLVATPFFEKLGFTVTNQNKVVRKSLVLINNSMSLKIKDS